MFADGHWSRVTGSEAAFESGDGNVYLVMALRNAGSGGAVIHGWRPVAERQPATDGHPDPDDFRTQVRDLYVAAGDIGLWQGALRDPL